MSALTTRRWQIRNREKMAEYGRLYRDRKRGGPARKWGGNNGVSRARRVTILGVQVVPCWIPVPESERHVYSPVRM